MRTGIDSNRRSYLQALIDQVRKPLDFVSVMNGEHFTHQELLFIKNKLNKKFPHLRECCTAIRGMD